jgi:hypothetical protein
MATVAHLPETGPRILVGLEPEGIPNGIRTLLIHYELASQDTGARYRICRRNGAGSDSLPQTHSG